MTSVFFAADLDADFPADFVPVFVFVVVFFAVCVAMFPPQNVIFLLCLSYISHFSLYNNTYNSTKFNILQ